MFSALNTNMLRFCVILFFIHGIVPLKIESVNIPYQVEDGKNAELTCTFSLNDREAASDVYVKWWRITGRYTRELLYQRKLGSDASILKHSFKKITPTDDNSIILSEIHPEHSGIFQCEVFTREDESRMSGKLTVFTKGSGPVLSVQQLEQNSTALLVKCQVSGVAPKPDLEIKINTKNILNTTQLLEGPENGRYNMSEQIVVSLDDEEAEFTCELFYEDVNITHPAYIETIKTDKPTGDGSNPLDKSTLLMIIFTIFSIGSTYLCWQP